MSDCPTAGRWRQALASIGRRPAAWVIAVTLAGTGLGAMLLAAIALWSVRPQAEQVSLAPEASVLLAAGASPAEVDALRASLLKLPAVAATRFVSRDAALAQLASRTAADRDAIGQLGANPLPDAIVLTFRARATPEAIESAAVAARKLARVDAVELELGWYRRLWALGRIGVVACLAVAAALVVQATGWLIVAVAVSAPIDARGAKLLWLLGADDRRVRRAPVTAAALTALAAAAIALLAARAGWVWLDRRLDSLSRLYASAIRLRWPAPAWLGVFVLAVLVAGLLIGSIRARTRLRAIRRDAAD
jgi:cell division transport system permease protein